MKIDGNDWKLQKKMPAIKFCVEYYSHFQSSVAAQLV